MRMSAVRSLVVAGVLALTWPTSAGALADDESAPSAPTFGSSVHIFSPSMDQAAIQAQLNEVSLAQVHNEFGSRRDAILFQPGTYGSKDNPLIFQVGYYTSVAGLGQSPGDVVINGEIEVFNSVCSGTGTSFGCFALNNFWRSLSNLTINVTKSKNPVYVPAPPDPGGPFCEQSNEIWAVSQAAPMRRVAINGFTTFMDYCGPKAFASGGFVADSKLDGVLNGSQQQWITRNSKIDFWTNAVWNQVFSGVTGAPAQSFPNPTYTTLATSPVTREAPYLYVDAAGNYNVFVPSVQHNTSGITWGSGPTPGASIPIDRFFVARPTDSVERINKQLADGKNLILTPGVYRLEEPIQVKHHDTVVFGLGFPTLVPEEGNAAMNVSDVDGVDLSGLIIDAGPEKSRVLLQLGSDRSEGERDGGNGGNGGDHSPLNPTALQDVFFRIGGAAAGKATTALVVNSDNVILDDIWSWRADHGNGVGWTSNTADTGVIVNGDNVTAYGLFVEHYQKYNVIWNGNGGTDIFFQNEMPYDVPNQAAWMEAPGVDGWAAFKVGSSVTSFTGYGMGSYSFFNKGVDIFAERAFEVPTTLPAGSLHDLLTIFLDPSHGKGGIRHVVNDTGGSSTIANPDAPVTVVSYP
jgi:hypothetical protein